MLELDKCLLAFLIPDKPFVTSEEVVEWQAFVGGSGDEPDECSYPTRKPLHFSTVFWARKVQDRGDLLWVGFDYPLRDYVSKELA